MGAQLAASKGMTTALSEAMKKGGKPADKTPPKITFTPSSGAKVISGAEDAGEKFEAILNETKPAPKALPKPTKKEKSDLLLGKMTFDEYKAKKQKEQETKDLLSSTKPTKEQKSDLLLGKISWKQYLKIKKKEQAAADKTPPKITFTPSSGTKVIPEAEDAGKKFEAILNDQAAMEKAAETKSEMPSAGNKNIFEGAYEKNQQYKAAQKEMQSKKAEEEYEKALKKTAMEKLQAAAAEKKAKYSSYSPFSKSDMPTAPKLQTPYPKYNVFGSNVPGSDPYGDQLKQYQLEQLKKQAIEQDKIKNLFAVISQGKQGQQPPAQG